MKRLTAAVLAAAFIFLCSLTACAETNSYKLSETTMNIFGGDGFVYMPDQQMFHFLSGGEASVELSVKDALYFYIIAGSDYSPSSGVTDNGENSGCSVRLECLNDSGENVMPAFPVLQIPADHLFHRYSIGKDTMFAGLPEDVSKVRVTFAAYDTRQYIRAMQITSDDTAARDMSVSEWEIHDLGNINAQTTKADYFIMVGAVAVVALIMMIFAKVRNNIKKGK